MLKALELRGFKSFADKTRLDFPPGITVVVGPNGSGKSNVVDAIKWVLGEQSAKSLRGKEMSDVIFKGAGEAGGRKPANAAEATIVFENSDGLLPVEAPEVHVTRRVYRSGEGEYLINRQACRLRDVRDLFRGTGVGTDAYSLIEQGKVDTLLQASARDRRAIFEEAAGISRFKAKKIEAQRRLERVDQNLLRLSDIVEEVDHRLRTVRSQASKARRYRQYTNRLQQLRTQVGRVDWRRLTENLRQIEAELKQLEQDVASRLTLEESLEARSLELETEVGLVSEELRACEARLARNRQRLAGQESVANQQHSRLRELDEEAARHRRQLMAMSMRAGDLDGKLHDVELALKTAEEHHQTLCRQVDELHRTTDQLTDQLKNRSAKSETLRSRYVEQVQSSADLASQISADQRHRSSAHTGAQRWQESSDRLGQQLARAQSELVSLQEEETALTETVRVEAKALDQAQIALRQNRKQLASVQERAGTRKGQRAGGRERADVLAELEARLEGVHAGVRQIWTLSQNEADGPFGGVRGLLADLIQVSVDTAAMVDVALGDRSQHLVVAGTRLLDYLRSDSCRLPGRAGFLWLTSSAPRGDAYRVRLGGQPGVIGRADEFVEAPPEYQLLIQWLLGSTWFVETLVDAFRLSQTAARGVRFVTRSGALLDSDGRVVAGSSPATVGLVSRRSQLRELRRDIERLDAEIEQLDKQCNQLQQTIEKQELDVQQRRTVHEQACAGLSQQRVRSGAVTQRIQDLSQQQTAAQTELQDAQRKQQEATDRLETAENQRAEHERALAQLKQQMQDFETLIQQLDAERQVASQALTTARVELAKAEQHLESLRVQSAQLHRDQEERSQAQQETRTQNRRCQQRHLEVQRVILQGSTEIAQLYLQQETDVRRSRTIDERRNTLQHDRRALGDRSQQLRRELHELEKKQHQKQLVAGKASLERDALAERLREDYRIELADLQDDAGGQEQHQRDAVDAEIRDLRRKLSNIGAVNLDALGELEELEGRSESLGGQYRDLVNAKESLERIIHKINADSRRLFTETLEAIRANFQELFRKVFGGGQADICLEEGVDILESGIDIVAMPPGKQSLSLSLLSGGERALTAVTLLLAIFQYRPSPFCVLDEVDGPLDEANIARFIGVLVEFLDWTKFVVVTHSKKTMTAANTLYGITMQESGVSKRVSVQFEDVSDDGHIRREAIQREPSRTLPAEGDGRGAA